MLYFYLKRRGLLDRFEPRWFLIIGQFSLVAGILLSRMARLGEGEAAEWAFLCGVLHGLGIVLLVVSIFLNVRYARLRRK